MADPSNGTTTTKPQLSDTELKTLAYFAIGVSSEGSIGPKNVAYHLSFAGTTANGKMTPVGNSGFTIGTLQTDFGAHPEVAADLVSAYQTWAAKQTPSLTLSESEKAQTTTDLQRDGKAIKADNNRALDETVRGNLDKFLASDDGVSFVHAHDRTQVERLMRPGDGNKDPGGALHQLQQTDLYKNASLDDQAKFATVVMKLENQAGKGQYPKILNGIKDGSLTSVDEVVSKVDAMLPNKVKDGKDIPDYIETGVHHALAGTEVFNKLRAAQPGNPLHDAFNAVAADPLRSPIDLKNDTAHPDARHQYDAIKTLFLQNGQAQRLIVALDQDTSFGYNVKNKSGKVSAQSSSLFGADNEFAVFDGNGHGTALVGGKWSAVERGDAKRVGNADQSVDLKVSKNGTTDTLLHVPTPAQLRERRDAQETPVPASPAPQHSAPANPNAPDHQNHTLLNQIRDGVGKIDKDIGKPYDEASERLSRAALAACRDNRGLSAHNDFPLASNALDRADEVTLSSKGYLVVVQGDPRDPAHKRAAVNVEQALNTPVEQSDQKLQAANLAIGKELQQARQAELERGMDVPNRGGPAMA
ncbi:XVIPCD domain-containing protein [Xanthomonas phaseoli]|uniref:XVIPCD domain-containing protein n=1 Tax=Xanthomonas phaseoli TaxID=1985254 RepID=UPI000317E607|nr:XVIPCD domain-containing protein [Xanthomonas phaseoli]